MRHVMTVGISGTYDGHDWPAAGQDAPEWLPPAELLHMVNTGAVRIVLERAAEPVVEISRPVAPEVRARLRRTKGAP